MTTHPSAAPDKGRPLAAIVNGAAGGGRAATRADAALRRLRDRYAIDVVHTEYPAHATELAADFYDRGYRRFLSVGGDGTTFEVINGLFPRARDEEARVELGLLPLGTGNSFLRDFGIESQEQAIAALSRWQTRPVDVVRADHTDGTFHYINLLGLGFTADVGDLTNRRFKRLGPAGYVAAVLSRLVDLKTPTDPIRIDENEEDTRPAVFLSFSNSKYTGGAMKMAPDADVGDGMVDIVRVGAISRGGLLATFPKIFAGTHTGHPLVEVSRARRIDFLQTRRQAVMVDGEVLHLALTSLQVQQGAVEIVA